MSDLEEDLLSSVFFSYLCNIIIDFNMSNKHLEQIKNWSIHLVFCTLFLYYFHTNCNLRPVASPHIYKEFLSGLITLAVIYLNYLLLFPKFYACRKYKAFWLSTFCSIAVSGCLEMILVYPELNSIYMESYGSAFVSNYLADDTLHVTLRNGGWVFFFIAINEIQRLRRQEQDKENVMRKKYGFVDVQNSDYSYGFISAKNIYYCEQEQNITNIYALDKKKYFKYCSMKRMEEILGPADFVRISRDIIVSKKFIKKYFNGQLELRGIDSSSNPKTLPVGKQYENRLTAQFQSTLNSKFAQNTDEEETALKKGKKEKVFVPKNKTIQEEFHQNPKLQAVYLHIRKNPNCNVNDISAKCRLPKGSVKRYITFLMDKKLIQHTGSRRYGGYNVVKA